MNGIINVLKPPGMSSFQVVRVLRGLLKIKHIGHAGTLDPGAAGVLLVGVGKACRLLHFISEFDKVYVAELTLGISTTTQDADGETTAVDETVSVTLISWEQLFQVLGRIEQIPMASAVKVNGKPCINSSGRNICGTKAAEGVHQGTAYQQSMDMETR